MSYLGHKLHDAVGAGDLLHISLIVAELQKEGLLNTLLSFQDYVDGLTPLMYAVRMGNVLLVELLLDTDANPNMQNNVGKSALHMSVECGHWDITNKLIWGNVNLNIQDMHGQSALHLAINCGAPYLVLPLLRAGIDVDLHDISGNTALHIALQHGNLQMAKHILDREANVNIRNNNGESPLCIAAKEGQINIAKSLIRMGADTHLQDIYGYTALHFAAEFGYQKTVALLIEEGANVNFVANGRSALHCAINKGHLHIAKKLLSHGMSPNWQIDGHWTAMHFAIHNNDLHAVRMLIEANIDPHIQDTIKSSFLHSAVRHKCRKDIIELLIKHGVDVNSQDIFGMTPLYHAVILKYSIAVSLLVNHGSKVYLRTNKGTSALDAAKDLGLHEILKILVRPIT